MIALINPYSVVQSIAMILFVIAVVGIVLLQAKRSSEKELQARCRFDDAVRFTEYLLSLTATEGDAVEVFARNREPETLDTQQVIACNGNWTGFTYERYNGRTVLDCLEKAALTRKLRENPIEKEIDNGSPE